MWQTLEKFDYALERAELWLKAKGHTLTQTRTRTPNPNHNPNPSPNPDPNPNPNPNPNPTQAMGTLMSRQIELGVEGYGGAA